MLQVMIILYQLHNKYNFFFFINHHVEYPKADGLKLNIYVMHHAVK